MSLNGIDIASWQEGISIRSLKTTDFVIVKATESTDYINPFFDEWAAATVACGKCLGCYHFARPGNPEAQAKYFLGKVKKYFGKAIFFLDWEENAIPLGPAWAKRWLDYVYKKTGHRPMIYMSKSVCNEYDWSKVVNAGYGLWVAQYPDYEPTGYKEPWTDSSKFGAWGRHWDIFQYTSEGKIPGYSGRLDLNKFAYSKATWNSLAKGGSVKQAISKVTLPTTKPSNSKKPAKKSIMTIANEVIAGKWGNGNERRIRLTQAGYDYELVQKQVNKLLFNSHKTVNQLAGEVIRGEWGNGDERRARLEAAGYDYDAVQNKVNELMY